jgi:hypothetical protein
MKGHEKVVGEEPYTERSERKRPANCVDST